MNTSKDLSAPNFIACEVCEQMIASKRGSTIVSKHIVRGGLYCEGSPANFAGQPPKRPAGTQVKGTGGPSRRVEADWQVDARRAASQGGLSDWAARVAERDFHSDGWTKSISVWARNAGSPGTGRRA